MRYLLCLFVLFLSNQVLAQRVMLMGKIVDENNGKIVGAHVRNITIDKITVSTIDGAFLLPAQPGDTLIISFVGFAQLSHFIDITDFAERMTLTLKTSTTSLSEVTILSLPTLDRFKEMVMEETVKDTADFWYFGLAKPKPKQYKMEGGQVHKKFLYAVLQPSNFLYYNLSKSEKEKRKFYQIQHQQDTKDNAEQKFTREWVAEQTGLEGDELTDFIAFCNFSNDYINKFTIYVIREDIMEKYILFKE